MSSTTGRRVWANLWDSSGAGYKGASADFVRLPDDAIVAEIRDGIHAKNLNKLGSVDSSDLKVYRDAAHFHARDTEGPLKSSGGMDGLGQSEEMALIVLVPSPSGRPPCFVVMRHSDLN